MVGVHRKRGVVPARIMPGSGCGVGGLGWKQKGDHGSGGGDRPLEKSVVISLALPPQRDGWASPTPRCHGVCVPPRTGSWRQA